MDPQGGRRGFPCPLLEVPELDNLTIMIRYMNLDSRKALLTLCRVQAHPTRNPRCKKLWRSLVIQLRSSELMPSHIHVEKWSTVETQLLSSLVILSGSCFLSGYFSMLVRCLPGISDDEASKALHDGLWKEIHATQGEDRLPCISYGSIFSNPEIQFYMESSIPPRPELNNETRLRFLLFKQEVSGHLFYPVYSRTKSLSRSTSTLYWQYLGFPERIRGRWNITSCDIQQVYHHYGHRVGGLVEVRQAWKFNDLKPRSYFAQGGLTYWKSSHIQPIFSALCDLFPSTNRYTRFNITDFHSIPQDDIILLYDYTSFTSSMSEQKRFLERLAMFFSGCMVRVFDLREGTLSVDLGHLINDYNQGCNVLSEFTLERFLEGEVILRHCVAGFLGVYGNITSCTLLHGLGLSQITIDRARSRCVGDDALGQLMYEGDGTLERGAEAVDMLGVCHPEKKVTWVEEGSERTGWHFLKRPINRIDGIMRSGALIDFPMIHYTTSVADGFHTVDKGTSFSRRKGFAKQTRRFLEKLHTIKDLMSDEDETVSRMYLQWCYRRLRLDCAGALYSDEAPFITPPVDEDLRTDYWLDLLLERHRGRVTRIPVPVVEDDVLSEDIPTRPYIGYAKKGWVMMRDMGYCLLDPVIEEVLLDGYYFDFHRRYLLGDERMGYSITLLQKIPEIFRSLVFTV